MVKVSGVPYEVKMDLTDERILEVKMDLTDERILELARECGASKVFVAGFSIAGNAKIIDFARRIVEAVSKG